jgi:hypothetical protein
MMDIWDKILADPYRLGFIRGFVIGITAIAVLNLLMLAYR